MIASVAYKGIKHREKDRQTGKHARTRASAHTDTQIQPYLQSQKQTYIYIYRTLNVYGNAVMLHFPFITNQTM